MDNGAYWERKGIRLSTLGHTAFRLDNWSIVVRHKLSHLAFGRFTGSKNFKHGAGGLGSTSLAALSFSDGREHRDWGFLFSLSFLGISITHHRHCEDGVLHKLTNISSI
jgi:hypothetical protein